MGEVETPESDSKEAIEVSLTAPPPQLTEVEVGGEGFSVRVSTAAPLGEALAAAERLWRLRSGQDELGSGSGGALDRRPSVGFAPSSTDYPAHHEVR